MFQLTCTSPFNKLNPIVNTSLELQHQIFMNRSTSLPRIGLSNLTRNPDQNPNRPLVFYLCIRRSSVPFLGIFGIEPSPPSLPLVASTPTFSAEIETFSLSTGVKSISKYEFFFQLSSFSLLAILHGIITLSRRKIVSTSLPLYSPLCTKQTTVKNMAHVFLLSCQKRNPSVNRRNHVTVGQRTSLTTNAYER